jgi:hypothetical protein
MPYSTPNKCSTVPTFGRDLSNTLNNKFSDLSITDEQGKTRYKIENISFAGESTPKSAMSNVKKISDDYMAKPTQPLHISGDLPNEANSNVQCKRKINITNTTAAAAAADYKDNTNDADDEKDSSSTYSSLDSNAAANETSRDKVSKLHIPEKSVNNYTQLIEQLLSQVAVTNTEANKNRQLVMSLEDQLEKMKSIIRDMEDREANGKPDRYREVIKSFSSKLIDLKSFNESYSETLESIQDNFDKVQRIQCDIYQAKLRDLEEQVKLRDEELQQMGADFATLQNWSMALFKELGDRSRSWSNLDFKITTQQVAQKIMPPLKKSNLENMYRYVLQFLYSDDQLSHLEERYEHDV